MRTLVVISSIRVQHKPDTVYQYEGIMRKGNRKYDTVSIIQLFHIIANISVTKLYFALCAIDVDVFEVCFNHS